MFWFPDGIDVARRETKKLQYATNQDLGLLRFRSKLEKSSDEVEDVKDDRPRIQAIDLLASRLTL